MRLPILFLLIASLCLAQRSDTLLPDAPSNALRFQTVYAVTTTAVNQCLAADATSRDCWVNYLHVNNGSGVAITVTVTNLAGDVFWSISVPATSATAESFNGGAKFVGGLKISASATGVTAWIRGARAL